MKVAVIDFETYYDKHVSVTRLGSAAYAQHPQADVQVIAGALYEDGKLISSQVGQLDLFDWSKYLEADLWLAHNATFEQAVYSVLVERGLAPPITPRWQCTANCSAYHSMARSLKDASEAILGVKISKEVRAEMKGVRWTELTDEEKQRWADYCLNDVYLAADIWHKASPSWPEIEQQLSQLTLQQATRGVAINVELLNRYIDQLSEVLEVNEKRLPWRADFAIEDSDEDESEDDAPPPGSTKAVNAQCIKDGIPLMPIKIHDRWGFEAWSQRHWHIEWVRAYLSYTLARKLYTDLVKLRERLINGIFYYELAYFGTYTGRWAGCGGWNMQNIRRAPVFIDKDCYVVTNRKDLKTLLDLAASGQALPENIKYVIDERSLFVARPGHNLVIVDLAQIEPRILAHFSGQKELLRRMANGESIYEAFARISGQWTRPEPLKKTDPTLYQAVKAQVLGLGYGCGEAKYREVAFKLVNMDLDLATARRHKLLYRRVASEVVRYWNDMDQLLNRALYNGGSLSIEVSPWRKLRYTKLHQVIKHNLGTEQKGGKPVAIEISGYIGVKPVAKLWGGKLVENKIQSCARDVFAELILRVERAGIAKCLWTVHDEAIFEIPKDAGAVAELEQAMEQAPDWLQIPVDVEVKVSDHYCK